MLPAANGWVLTLVWAMLVGVPRRTSQYNAQEQYTRRIGSYYYYRYALWAATSYYVDKAGAEQALALALPMLAVSFGIHRRAPRPTGLIVEHDVFESGGVRRDR